MGNAQSPPTGYPGNSICTNGEPKKVGRPPFRSRFRLPQRESVMSQPSRGPVSSFPVSVASMRSEEHTSELQSQSNLVCRLLLEKKNTYVTETNPLRTRKTLSSMPH